MSLLAPAAAAPRLARAAAGVLAPVPPPSTFKTGGGTCACAEIADSASERSQEKKLTLHCAITTNPELLMKGWPAATGSLGAGLYRQRGENRLRQHRQIGARQPRQRRRQRRRLQRLQRRRESRGNLGCDRSRQDNPGPRSA